MRKAGWSLLHNRECRLLNPPQGIKDDLSEGIYIFNLRALSWKWKYFLHIIFRTLDTEECRSCFCSYLRFLAVMIIEFLLTLKSADSLFSFLKKFFGFEIFVKNKIKNRRKQSYCRNVCRLNIRTGDWIESADANFMRKSHEF